MIHNSLKDSEQNTTQAGCKPLLFEIGCEELPAKGLSHLAEALLANVTAGLTKHHLSFDPETTCYATPRRIALFINDCQVQKAPQTLVRKGPKLAQAFTADGKPTPAALGFAKSCGVMFDQLSRDEECLCFSQTSSGQATLELLPEILTQAIHGLPIARPMRWGSTDTAFVRPVKWLCALFGADIVPLRVFDLDADRCSYGHRFMAPQAIRFECAERAHYENTLHEAYVIADFAKRQSEIHNQLEQQAAQQQSNVVLDPALLHEVTGLVEWPVALTIPFDPRFLTLPKEALIASMQGHQKCFAIENAQQTLQPAFITVSNINSKDSADVIRGNKRVMHARLSDAEFFYEQDGKTPLATYQAVLDTITFQHQLGSMGTKVSALVELSSAFAKHLGANLDQTRQAARLAKSDLCTHMVSEFPELQGLMGMTYALQQGLPAEVATALSEQYLPRFAGDTLPTTATSSCLALADRLLNLIGLFGVGQVPSGTKDPFALRRAALGVIRILLAQSQNLSLSVLLQQTIDSWNGCLEKPFKKELHQEVKTFILERLRYFWLEQAEFSQSREAIDAVLARQDDIVIDAQARLQAIVVFQTLAEASALASAYKRVNNFLTKEQSTAATIQPELFEQACEQVLFEQLECCEAVVQPLLDKADYLGALQQLTQLKDPIDAFFTDVMVLVDNLDLRANRLALLARLHRLLGAVADL